MKILHIIDSGGLYGAEIMLLNLVAEQMRLGLKPIIASIGGKDIDDKPLESEALKRGIQVKRFRMYWGPNYVGASRIIKYALYQGVDILHSHGYKGNILFGLMPRKIRKLPLITTIHGWTNTNNGFSKMKLYEWLDSRSLKFIDAVVLVSKAMESNPKLKNRKDINVSVVKNGIPIWDDSSSCHLLNHTASVTSPSPLGIVQTSDSADLDQSIIDFCRGGYVIGSMGRLSREKGYNYLVEALGILIKMGIDARLVIVGEGNERDYLEGLVAQRELSDRVMLPGYRKGAKEYLPYFSVFAISSLTEGLPITLLEAMYARIPIVATEVGGIPELLEYGRAGLLIKPRNADAVAEALSLLRHDERLANELTNVAYHRVTTHYTSKTMALEYLDIYNGATNRTKPA